MRESNLYYQQEPKIHKKTGGFTSLCGKSQLNMRLSENDEEVTCQTCLNKIKNGGVSRDDNGRRERLRNRQIGFVE